MKKPRKPCRLCGGVREPGVIRSTCRACAAQESRARYHSDPQARALQLGYATASYVRRHFPEAETGLKAAEYAQLLLAAEACAYFGEPNAGEHPFNLDHRTALALGGRHELANLEACCEPCNRAKRNMPPEKYRAWLAGVRARG